jgi:3-oxocholest-4-en-26-oyl-CoA dehydrogenase beta subunit
MNTILSDEQSALEEACRTLLQKEWPLEKALRVLGAGGSGHSVDLWRVLAEAGWMGMPFSSEFGGAGGNLLDLGLVYRAAGERLVPASYYSCMFAALLLARIGTLAQQRELLPRIISGAVMVTVGYSEPQSIHDFRFLTTAAERRHDGWVISGTKAFVPNLDLAEIVFVLARVRANIDRTGWRVFTIDRKYFAGSERRHSTFGGEPLFELRLDDLKIPSGAVLGEEPSGAETLEDFVDVIEQTTSLQCMEMVGGAGAVLERTIEYLAGRRQHGRPLATFQAVQHLLANISIQLQGARMAALKALYQKSRGKGASREIAIAKIAAGETYSNATISAHQVWGAMGYARETGLYLWSERAKVSDAWLGTRSFHLRKLADAMEL